MFVCLSFCVNINTHSFYFQIILLTDGEVGNTSQLIGLVKSHANNTRYTQRERERERERESFIYMNRLKLTVCKKISTYEQVFKFLKYVIIPNFKETIQFII